MIAVETFRGRTVAVLGLGRSGLAAAQALLAGGAQVTAWDDNAETRARAVGQGIAVCDLADADWHRTAALILSPGIPHTHPQPHPMVARARTAGTPVIGDIELMAGACPQAAYVGITGTNGKSTTTALLGHIVKSAGRVAEVGGNLGQPVLSLAPQGPDGVYILELSSYQLELAPSARFDVAVLLNISPDHLDRHGGMEGYVAAKRLIFRHQVRSCTAVIGIDDAHCDAIWRSLVERGDRRVVPVSTERAIPGGVYADGTLLLDASEGAPRAVLDLGSAPALPGRHNRQNAAAAYAAARALGIDAAAIAQAIITFPGLAHRQERVAEISGVTFVNDSKATNADAAARALDSYDTIYWIAGGRAKEGGIESLAPWFGRIRRAYLIGEASAAFARTLAGRVDHVECGTLDRALASAAADATADRVAGAVVLLSPACASFDQFSSFEVRGDAFRTSVLAFAAGEG
jgi:UDP-N-acetylmuramoylalanine--D-glutamate ligase